MKRNLVLFFCLCIIINVKVYSQDNPPNIIVIVTDDQRWDTIGAMGNYIIQTPNLDQLASEATLFENAFVTTPICAASRASIITGLYERGHGFTFRTPPLKKKFIDISYPKLLKDAGYKLGFFGKFGMQFEDEIENELFDELKNSTTSGYFRLRGPGWSEHVHLTDLTTDEAIEFIDNLEDDEPFCVSLSYNAPHADDTNPRQYVWPERNDTLYVNTELPEIPLKEQEYYDQLPEILKDSLYLGNIRYKWRYDNPEKAENMIKGYYRMITTIDQNIGRLREFLEEKDLAKNTIILFIGDNGYFLGERKQSGKWLLYENSLRVPFMIYDPNAEPSRDKQMVLNIDIAPTVLSYAGVSIPEATQGKDLKNVVQNKASINRDEFLCEHLYEIPYIPKIEGIRTKKYKYFRYIGTDIEELYDLENDKLEINNLVNNTEYAKVLDELRYKTDTLIKQNSTLIK